MRTPTRILGVSALAAALFLGGPVAAASAAPARARGAGRHPADHGSRRHLLLRPAVPGARHARPDRPGRPVPVPAGRQVFQNREGILPQQSAGYYHEYTVDTPGSPDRGARRIITGQQTDEDYYTSDHYESFDLVDFDC